jgi:trigger factor
LALIEGCRHELELTIPAAAVQAETSKAVDKIRAKVHLKGFRPGKAPAHLIRSYYSSEIRKEIIDALIPKHLETECEKEGLRPVSQPSMKDLHFHDGEELHCKVEFEVAPDIELKEVRGLKVEYAEPQITGGDVDARIESIRQAKAEFVNVDPRPAVDGDHCLVSLESIAGLEGPPMKQAGLNIEIGHADTFAAFSEALRGTEPGDQREAEIEYPENYAEPRLSGKKVRFRITLEMIRQRELPELNDEFAQDLGDFQTVDELKEEIRKSLFREREFAAQAKAKNDLVDKAVEMHDFPVPEVFVERQIETIVQSSLQEMSEGGVDVSKLKLDWAMLKQRFHDRAVKEVKASLLLDKIATVESIEVMQDEVDRQVQQIARQEREPVAATRARLEKEGAIRRIALRIRTDKTLNLLFEHAVKEAPQA